MGRMNRSSKKSSNNSGHNRHHRTKKATTALSSSSSVVALKDDDVETDSVAAERTPHPTSWVDRLRLVPVPVPGVVDDPQQTLTQDDSPPPPPPPTISIVTWNVLAQAYCSRHSQVELPKEYNRVVFHKTKRKQRIIQLLPQLLRTHPNERDSKSAAMFDVCCWQEVDLNEIRPVMEQLGYSSVVETPRCRGNQTTAGGRIDGCSIYVRTVDRSDMDDTVRTVFDTESDHAAAAAAAAVDAADADNKDGHTSTETTNAQDIGPNTSTANTTAATPTSQRSPVQWKLVGSELIRLDDLATLSSSTATASAATEPGSTSHANTNDNNNNNATERDSPERNMDDSPETATSHTYADANANTNTTGNNSNVQGIQQSLLRRNMAIMIRLQHVTHPERTVIVVNAHLFWNPAFEYVKLCQAHYILLRAQQYQRGPYEPVVLCGDLNSRPHGVTHTYLSHGSINAKRIAPWYQHPSDGHINNNTTTPSLHQEEIDSSLSSSTITPNDKNKVHQINDSVGPGRADESHARSTDVPALLTSVREDATTDERLVRDLSALELSKTINATTDDTVKDSKPCIRYLLDASLNKLCRWLRILGQDVAIETDDEEKLRTGKGEMVIFERCKNEHRTLVTTSPRLLQRRDCPTSVYCIHPPYLSHLEVAMIHMLLSHGVELIPSTFLSRCVVCNGKIIEEHDDTRKRQILTEYEAPPALIDEGMAVFVCDGCQQGYWWNDRPKSSASRVKTAATRLFELCVRAGVPIRYDDDDDDDGMFQLVNYQQLREEGWDYTTPGSELLLQKLDVMEWLKRDQLKCPFPLESAYLDKSNDNQTFREILPFTNITHHFVDTLDYIFFDKSLLYTIERLKVPSTFDELSDGRTHIENAHLLPSDVWPSDHLAIAARLAFRDPIGVEQNESMMKRRMHENGETDKDAVDGTYNDNTATISSSSDVESDAIENNPMLYCGFIGDATTSGSSSGSASLPQPLPQFLQGNGPNVHVNDARCACGCVPSIPSLFEMAELRKQAKLKRAIAK